jgi:hypothetical protein
MTITLELSPDVEARLRDAAEQQHLPVEEIIKAYLHDFHPVPVGTGTLAKEIDRGFDEAADLIPEGIPPLSGEAFDRETIYIREDDWDR